MTARIRSASLTHFAELAAACGLEARALLVEVDLPARCLDEPDLKISAQKVGRLLELAAARAGEPAFGLRLAESRRLSNLGPLGLLVREEPTLRSALEALVRHIHLHNEALVMRVESAAGLVVLREVLLSDSTDSLRQATELAIGVTFRVLRIFMGAQWRPRLVCFTHRAPKDLSAHRRVFGDAVEFGHDFNGIVCAESDLDLPNPGADPVMARYARQLLTAQQSGQATMTHQVRQLVVVLMPLGHCRVEVVARHMGVDRRTVARRLTTERTSFSGVMDAVRRELVVRYVNEGARSLTDVSALLGFSAPSAFSRWHRQAFGASARQARPHPERRTS